MKDLRCAMRDCGHNRAFCCAAREIQVDEKAECDTYKPSDEKPDRDNDNIMFEFGVDVGPDEIRNTKIYCGACKCLFNKEKRCVANGISVVSEKRDALCSTYISK